MSIPGWLQVLLSEKFFNSCLVHQSHKRNDDNRFCLDCCVALCLHCLPSHKAHRLLQIRRYMYQDVLELKDAKQLIECSFIQIYTVNNAKVLYLKQRPSKRLQMKRSDKCCIICEQHLQDPYMFCSIFCKMEHGQLVPRLTTSSNSTVPTKPKDESSSNTCIVSECTFRSSPRKSIPTRSPLY